MHGLIPRAVDEALQERGIEPIDTPNIKDVALEEGQPLKFTAAIETVPPFDPGDLSTLEATRPPSVVTDEAVDTDAAAAARARREVRAGRRTRHRPKATRSVLDIERTGHGRQPDRHESVSIELGSAANPPGFDAQLIGLQPGEDKTFTIHFPEDYAVKEMANTDVDLFGDGEGRRRRRCCPNSTTSSRRTSGSSIRSARCATACAPTCRQEAEEHATRHVRTEVLKQLSERVTFDLPPSLVEREIDRRLEEFARQLMQQNVDPRQAGIDWAQFREAQREPARASVASALALDEIARREGLTVSPEDVDKEIERFAVQGGPHACRAPCPTRKRRRSRPPGDRTAAGEGG